MTKQDLVIGHYYWVDGNALKTNKAQLKYVGKKYVIVESLSGTESWHTLDFFLEWATVA